MRAACQIKNGGSEMWSAKAISSLASEERDRKKIKIEADSSTILMTLGIGNSEEMAEVPRDRSLVALTDCSQQNIRSLWISFAFCDDVPLW
jgi:hypothetical protein